jgi:hypothetical protein
MSVDDAGARTTRWGLWVRGRLRTTVVLGDDTGEHLADLSLHGWPRKRRRLVAATDDGVWTVAVRPGRLTVEQGSERRITVDGERVELAGARLVWPVLDGGMHRGPVRASEDGPVVLAVTPGADGKDQPTALIDFDPDVLPDPLGLVLAACAVQLITQPRGSMLDGMDPGVGFDIGLP